MNDSTTADSLQRSAESREADRRRRLGRLRNSVLGVVLLLAVVGVSLAFGWHGVAVQQRQHLPTRLLLALAPHEPTPSSPLMTELLRRLVRDQLSHEQSLALLELVVAGDANAEPPGETWRRRYGRIAGHWRQPGVRPVDERRRLYEIPPRVAVAAPPVWDPEATTSVHLRIRDWWPPETVCRIRIQVPTAMTGSEREIVAIRAAGEGGRRALVIPVPTPSAETDELLLTIHIDRRADDPIGGAPISAELVERDVRWTPLHSIQLPLAIGARVRVEDALVPLVDERLDEAIREVFRIPVQRWRDGAGRVAFQFLPHAMADRIDEEFAVGVEVELQEDGVTRRRSRIWWLVADGRMSSSEWDPPDEDREAITRLLALERDDPALSAWHLRITSRPDLALRAFGTSEDAAGRMTLPARYWHGEVVIPLEVDDRSDSPPLRSWHRLSLD